MRFKEDTGEKVNYIVVMVDTVTFTKKEEYVLGSKKFKFAYSKLEMFTELESEYF